MTNWVEERHRRIGLKSDIEELGWKRDIEEFSHFYFDISCIVI